MHPLKRVRVLGSAILAHEAGYQLSFLPGIMPNHEIGLSVCLRGLSNLTHRPRTRCPSCGDRSTATAFDIHQTVQACGLKPACSRTGRLLLDRCMESQQRIVRQRLRGTSYSRLPLVELGGCRDADDQKWGKSCSIFPSKCLTSRLHFRGC